MVWVVGFVLCCGLYSMFCACGLICVVCRRAGVVMYVVCSFGLMCDVRYWFCVMAGVACLLLFLMCVVCSWFCVVVCFVLVV